MEVIDAVSTKIATKYVISSSAVAEKPRDVPCHMWKRFLRLSWSI